MPAVSGVTGALIAVAVLAAATAFGLWWRSRQGRLSAAAPAVSTGQLDALQGLGLPADRVTLLQFSSRVCAPCRATTRLLTGIVAEHPVVAHVEVDVEEHLDAVTALGIRRTPTLFILDRRGDVVTRASGLPERADVEAALQPLIGSR